MMGTTSEKPVQSPRVRIPIAQVASRPPRLDHFIDESVTPSRSRIRKLAEEWPQRSDELIAMGTMVRAHDGGPLRTFSGGLAHENGWYPSRKARRLLHWEGVAQRSLVVRSEVDFGVERIGTESVAFEFTLDGKLEHYTVDVEIVSRDGRITLWEVKRDKRDLNDPIYRRKLAAVAEICRRCDIDFEVVFRNEIFTSRHHASNAELFASRAFASVSIDHLRRLEAYALATGCHSTYGALAEALEPRSIVQGKALIQALTVRQRVEIDLTARLVDDTHLTIH